MNTRDKEVMQEYEVLHDSIRVDFYDDALIDGDTVTIIYNGSIIATQQLLTDKPLRFYLKLDKTRKKNELIMYAENLGSIPPNTAIMIIYDGEKRYEARMSSSNTKNGTVNFILKQ